MRSREHCYAEIQDGGLRLAAGVVRLLHALSVGFGLGPNDFQAYMLLRIEGPMTPGEIAQCLRLATGSVTALIDRLEARGLVTRAPHRPTGAGRGTAGRAHRRRPGLRLT